MTVFNDFGNLLSVAKQAAFYEMEIQSLQSEIVDYNRRLSEAQDALANTKKLKDDFYNQLKDR